MRRRNASNVSSPAGVAHAAIHSAQNTIPQRSACLVIDMGRKNYTIRSLLANLALETPRKVGVLADLRGRFTPVCLLTNDCRLACAFLRALQRCNNAHRNPSQE